MKAIARAVGDTRNRVRCAARSSSAVKVGRLCGLRLVAGGGRRAAGGVAGTECCDSGPREGKGEGEERGREGNPIP